MADISGKKIFVNADVTTLNPSSPKARGIIVEGSKIAGLLDDKPAGLSKDVRVVDCAGAAIVPGLHDCHVHLTDTGLLAGDHDLSDAASVDALLRRVRSLSDPMLFAGNIEEERLAEAAMPTMAQLDSVSDDRPVLLSRIDGHSCVVNAAALALTGADALEGVERDAAGDPTGRLFGAANYRAQRAFVQQLPRRLKAEADIRAADMALRAGITTAHHVILADGTLESLQEQYRCDATLPIHVISKTCTTEVKKVRQLGGKLFGGDILLDGSIGSRTAAVESGYRDGAGSGFLYLSDDQLESLFDEAAESGLSLGVHAIGDRAIEQAIAAWEKVIKRRGPLRAVRPSIDHFEIAHPDQIARAARCGIFLSMQPAFDHLWGGSSGMYAQRFGPELALEMNRFKTAKRAGCLVCGGSDSPVTKFSALLGIASLVNHHVPEERFSVEEALRAYSADAAKLSFDEHRRGTLAAGMDADFTVLERGLDAVERSAIKDVRVIATIVGGDIRYDATA
jgi:predicted amidohydrolase YtcJ